MLSMLRIRLSRVGKKNQPQYRIVVCEKTAPVKGKNIDIIGYYNPIKKNLKIDEEKYKKWLSQGAQPSERVKKLKARIKSVLK